MSKSQKGLLKKLLLNQRGNTRFWVGVVVLTLGTVLLLLSVIIWSGFDYLLENNSNHRLGESYLTIQKKVQDDIANQKQQTFSIDELEVLNALPQVKDIGVFTAANFNIEVSFTDADSQYFSSDIFLESVPDRFIDNKPIDWYWQYDSQEVPVIVSTEFLNLYNYGFAPNEGVPQLTKGTISSLLFGLDVGTYPDNEVFAARVVGFSDRISSILVPQSFIDYGNEHFSKAKTKPARAIIHVLDPADKSLISFLREREYETSGELLRWNKLRAIVDQLAVGIAALIIIVLAICVIVFYLFTDASLSKSKNDLQLLLQLGYHPKFLSWLILKWYGSVLLLAMSLAGVIAIILQVRVAKYLNGQNLVLYTFPSEAVWFTLLGITLLLLVVVNVIVKRALKS